MLPRFRPDSEAKEVLRRPSKGIEAFAWVDRFEVVSLLDSWQAHTKKFRFRASTAQFEAGRIIGPIAVSARGVVYGQGCRTPGGRRQGVILGVTNPCRDRVCQPPPHYRGNRA